VPHRLSSPQPAFAAAYQAASSAFVRITVQPLPPPDVRMLRQADGRSVSVRRMRPGASGAVSGAASSPEADCAIGASPLSARPASVNAIPQPNKITAAASVAAKNVFFISGSFPEAARSAALPTLFIL
jgi:hypothetical protein